MSNNIRTFEARLSKNDARKLEKIIDERSRILAGQAVNIGVQNVFLQTLYVLFEHYGWRGKRIHRFCEHLMAQKLENDKMYNEQTMVALMLSRMKNAGVDVYDTFEDLLKNEEERFDAASKAEQFKRISRSETDRRKAEIAFAKEQCILREQIKGVKK